MSITITNVLPHLFAGIIVAAVMALALPSTARAFWFGGVWIEPAPVPHPYVLPPPLPYYAPVPGRAIWVAPRWDGYRWIPGYWNRY